MSPGCTGPGSQGSRAESPRSLTGGAEAMSPCFLPGLLLNRDRRITRVSATVFPPFTVCLSASFFFFFYGSKIYIA